MSKRSDPPASDEPVKAAPPRLPPARVWLVDGYNVLHTVLLGGQARESWWRAGERERLRARVWGFTDPNAELWLVFDGSTPNSDPLNEPDSESSEGDVPGRQRVRVVFAPDADDWIRRRAKQLCGAGDAEAGSIAVVTADRRLADRSRHAGAQIVRPRDFIAHCPDPRDGAE